MKINILISKWRAFHTPSWCKDITSCSQKLDILCQNCGEFKSSHCRSTRHSWLHCHFIGLKLQQHITKVSQNNILGSRGHSTDTENKCCYKPDLPGSQNNTDSQCSTTRGKNYCEREVLQKISSLHSMGCNMGCIKVTQQLSCELQGN